MPPLGRILDSPTQFDAWTLAEWIEASMLLEEGPESREWSRTAILTAFPSGAEPDQAELDETFLEIRRRSDVAPTVYPFGVTENGVVRMSDEVDPRIYRFLVLISQPKAPYRKHTARINKVNRLFDLLVREAMKGYLGGAAIGLRFGWPAQDGRPQLLVEAIPWLADQLGLAVISTHDLKPADKDAGVDVIAWKPFAAGGPAFSCRLLQDTVALDYVRKPGDIAPYKWLVMINFGTPPPVGLAIPFALEPGSHDFEEIKYRAELFFDRLRICEHLDGRDLEGYDEWEAIRLWNEEQAPLTAAALSTPAPVKHRREKPG